MPPLSRYYILKPYLSATSQTISTKIRVALPDFKVGSKISVDMPVKLLNANTLSSIVTSQKSNIMSKAVIGLAGMFLLGYFHNISLSFFFWFLLVV